MEQKVYRIIQFNCTYIMCVTVCIASHMEREVNIVQLYSHDHAYQDHFALLTDDIQSATILDLASVWGS